MTNPPQQWFIDLGRRRRQLPGPVRDALARINEIACTLIAAGRMEFAPMLAGIAREPITDCSPPYWRLNLPFDLEVDGPNAAEYVAGVRGDLASTRDQYNEAQRIYAKLIPLIRANESLLHELYRLSFDGRDVLDPECVRALMRYRNALAPFVPPKNPIVAAVLLEFDQGLDRIVDAIRTVLIRRYIAGTLSADEAQEIAAVLQGQYDQGLWADPEGDIAGIEEELGLPPAEVGFGAHP